MSTETQPRIKHIVSLSDVSHMSDVIDCEVMNAVIVAETASGLWFCQGNQKKGWSDMNEVPFYRALPWMESRWAQVTGTGKTHENDQLEDARIKDLATIEIEEMHATPIDTYACDFDELMPGASSNEYHGHVFDLWK